MAAAAATAAAAVTAVAVVVAVVVVAAAVATNDEKPEPGAGHGSDRPAALPRLSMRERQVHLLAADGAVDRPEGGHDVIAQDEAQEERESRAVETHAPVSKHEGAERPGDPQ